MIGGNMEKPALSTFLKSPIQRKDLEESDEVEEVIKVVRGKRGQKGDKGDIPSVEELEAIILPLIPDPIPGEKGKDGKSISVEEVLPIIQSLIPEIKDGKTPTKAELTDIVKSLLPEQKETETDTPKEIIEKINKSRGEKIKKSKIEGFDDIESQARSANNKIQKYLLMGGSTLVKLQANGVPLGDFSTLNFINGTVTNSGGTANYTSTGGGGGNVALETPVGTVNGVNTTFTVANAPIYVLVDGVAKFLTINYTYSAPTVTITDGAPPTQTIYSLHN